MELSGRALAAPRSPGHHVRPFPTLLLRCPQKQSSRAPCGAGTTKPPPHLEHSQISARTLPAGLLTLAGQSTLLSCRLFLLPRPGACFWPYSVSAFPESSSPTSLATCGWSNSFMQAASLRNSSMSLDAMMSAEEGGRGREREGAVHPALTPNPYVLSSGWVKLARGSRKQSSPEQEHC